MVGQARDYGVDVRFDLAAELPPVRVKVIEIEQVILNLLSNGIEAMKGSRADIQPIVVQTRLAGAQTVEVSVTDRGPGLSPEAEERIFEPFFTTKPSGMGMGLSICRTIVEAHGGRLWAEARPGGGTTFRFSLPTLDGDPSAAA